MKYKELDRDLPEFILKTVLNLVKTGKLCIFVRIFLTSDVKCLSYNSHRYPETKKN